MDPKLKLLQQTRIKQLLLQTMRYLLLRQLP